MKKTAAILAAIVLSACGSKERLPEWQSSAQDSLEAFSDAWLHGRSTVADAEFRRALADVSGTGKLALAARVHLVRCAAQVAALDFTDCAGYAPLAQDAEPAEREYEAYIGGRWQEVDAALLPPQHRPVVAGGRVAAIADPLARLVAAGAALRAGRITPEDIGVAVDTASEQGWRRPLLAWLGVQLKRAEAGGDTAASALIRRRIELAGSNPR